MAWLSLWSHLTLICTDQGIELCAHCRVQTEQTVVIAPQLLERAVADKTQKVNAVVGAVKHLQRGARRHIQSTDGLAETEKLLQPSASRDIEMRQPVLAAVHFQEGYSCSCACRQVEKRVIGLCSVDMQTLQA